MTTAAAVNKRLIVVLGMHRSGTSVLTRALAALDIDLGNEFIPNVSAENAKGFWEDAEINNLNIKLLQAINTDWFKLSPIRNNELFEKNNLRHEAIQLLEKKFSNRDLLAIKNPRFCILLPFWKSVFKEMNLKVDYIFAIRNPLSISLSLLKRNTFPHEQNYFMWLSYVSHSFIEARNNIRLVVDFDRLMNNPKNELLRIANALELPFNANSKKIKEYTDLFLDKTLRHSEFSLEELNTDPSVPKDTFVLYNCLLSLSKDELSIDSESVDSIFLIALEKINYFDSGFRLIDLFQDLNRKANDLIAKQEQEIADYKTHNIKLADLIREREADIQSFINTINQMKSSNSLRITRPMRYIKNTLIKMLNTIK
jgi:hypothetical protein